MKILARIATITAVATLSLGAISAQAGKGHHGGGGGRIFKKLIKAGALTRDEVKALRPAREAARECRKAVRAGSQPKGSCMPKFIDGAKAHLALLQGALPKVTDGELKAKVERHIAKMTRRIAKMEARAAAPVAPPAQ